MLCLCFGLLAIFYWRLAWIIAVDYAVLGGWRRNFVKCVIFPPFWQACVVAYLTLEMRSDYAKCVVVGRSAIFYCVKHDTIRHRNEFFKSWNFIFFLKIHCHSRGLGYIMETRRKKKTIQNPVSRKQYIFPAQTLQNCRLSKKTIGILQGVFCVFFIVEFTVQNGRISTSSSPNHWSCG